MVKKITSPPRVAAVATAVDPAQASNEDFLITPEHADDDDAYHAGLREHLAELLRSLCDTALTDALAIARAESARRAEGRN